MSDKPQPGTDLATRAQWQRWEMESLESLRINPGRRASDRNAAERQARMRRQQAQALAEAQKAGRTQGYQEGCEQGLREGRAKGLEIGRREGREQGRREGHAEGLQEGRALGHTEGAQQARDEAARLATLAGACAQALNGLEEEVGQSLIRLATRIAEQVLRTHLRDHPNQILELIQEVLQAGPQQRITLHLRLHPDDVALVQAFLQQNPELGACQLIADEQITRGGCVAETPQGSIDATLETRWLRIVAALGGKPDTP